MERPEVEWDPTFEGTREAQIRSWLRATPAERLAWLEEMLEFARAAGALDRARALERGREG